MGMSDQINLDDAVEWVGEAVELIGVPFQYIEKVEYVNIKEYKGKLPCDLLNLISVNGHSGYIEDESCLGTLEYMPMRYSTDTFHHRYCKNLSGGEGCSLTYKLNDDYIFPNFEEGAVAIAYHAMPTDERGFPLVADDVKFRRAATDYLKWKLAFIEFSKGKMPSGVYQIYDQEKCYSMGAAQTRGQMPSIDMLESIKNNWLRLIPKINHHSTNFKGLGEQEQRILHNVSAKNENTGLETKDGGTFFHNS
jgi:hypothetical protein